MVDNLKIAVLFGGPSPEHDVSILTGLQALRALKGSAVGIYWTKSDNFYLLKNPSYEAVDFLNSKVPGSQEVFFRIGAQGGFFQKTITLKKLDIDVVVNCCHGGPGEDGTIQAIFELTGIPLTGPDVFLAQLGMDKWMFYKFVEQIGINTLNRELLIPGVKKEISFDPPYILKPRFGGSSLGIEIVSDLPTAMDLLEKSPHFAQGAVVEPFRQDLFDLQLAVRTFPTLEISEIEKPIKEESSAFLNYSDKYVAQEGMAGAQRELPANIDEFLKGEIIKTTQRLTSVIKFKGITRVDFLSDGKNELYLNEINTIPGSLARYLFISPKRDFRELLNDMINEAIKFNSYRYTTVGADGSLLKSVDLIANKLG